MTNCLQILKTGFFALFLTFCTSNILAKASESPNISAQNAITIDMKTKEIIFSKNIDQKVQPASVTKLLTALLLDEHKKKNDTLFYSEDALLQPSVSIFLDFSAQVQAGDEINASTAMDALLIYSANDVATLIADNISGSIDEFSILMNEKAKEIGMENSNFYTPSGLDNDKRLFGNDHYTTAYDLSKLGVEALKSDWIRETIAKKSNIEIDVENDTPIIIDNTNNNLGKNGCIGGKTGYTEKAQRCLLSFYERDGRYILGVVLGCPTRTDSFKDMETIINYSYDAKKEIAYKKGDTITTKTIDFKPLKFMGPTLNKEVNIIATEDISFYKNEDNNIVKPEILINDFSPSDLSEKTEIGTITYNFRDHSASFKLSTLETFNDFIGDASHIYFIFAIGVLTSILLAILAYKKIIKKKQIEKTKS